MIYAGWKIIDKEWIAERYGMKAERYGNESRNKPKSVFKPTDLGFVCSAFQACFTDVFSVRP